VEIKKRASNFVERVLEDSFDAENSLFPRFQRCLSCGSKRQENEFIQIEEFE
jgi:hypothetical protein